MRQPIDLQAVQAASPESTGIGQREHFDPNWVLTGLPQDTDRRLQRLEEVRQHAQASLELNRQRYDDLRTRGLDALSAYDIDVCHQGDGLGALIQALRFKAAHISWDASHLATVDAELERISREERPQMGLF